MDGLMAVFDALEWEADASTSNRQRGEPNSRPLANATTIDSCDNDCSESEMGTLASIFESTSDNRDDHLIKDADMEAHEGATSSASTSTSAPLAPTATLGSEELAATAPNNQVSDLGLSEAAASGSQCVVWPPQNSRSRKGFQRSQPGAASAAASTCRDKHGPVSKSLNDASGGGCHEAPSSATYAQMNVKGRADHRRRVRKASHMKAEAASAVPCESSLQRGWNSGRSSAAAETGIASAVAKALGAAGRAAELLATSAATAASASSAVATATHRSPTDLHDKMENPLARCAPHADHPSRQADHSMAQGGLFSVRSSPAVSDACDSREDWEAAEWEEAREEWEADGTLPRCSAEPANSQTQVDASGEVVDAASSTATCRDQRCRSESAASCVFFDACDSGLDTASGCLASEKDPLSTDPFVVFAPQDASCGRPPPSKSPGKAIDIDEPLLLLEGCQYSHLAGGVSQQQALGHDDEGAEDISLGAESGEEDCTPQWQQRHQHQDQRHEEQRRNRRGGRIQSTRTSNGNSSSPSLISEVRSLQKALCHARAERQREVALAEDLAATVERLKLECEDLRLDRERLGHENRILTMQLEDHHGIMAADWAQTLNFQERLRQEELEKERLAAEVALLQEQLQLQNTELMAYRQDATHWRLLTGPQSLKKEASYEALEALQDAVAPSVSRLQEELQRRMRTSQEQLRLEMENQLCVVCRDEKKTVLFLPCAHLCVCEYCRSQLRAERCPMCQEPVQSYVARVHF